MINDESVNVQALAVGICLGVLQQLEEKVGGLLWPATDRCSPLFGLSAAADATVEATEWNALLLIHDILQEALGATQWHLLDDVGGLAGVLQIERI